MILSVREGLNLGLLFVCDGGGTLSTRWCKGRFVVYDSDVSAAVLHEDFTVKYPGVSDYLCFACSTSQERQVGAGFAQIFIQIHICV